jgi:hypothetical protein
MEMVMKSLVEWMMERSNPKAKAAMAMAPPAAALGGGSPLAPYFLVLGAGVEEIIPLISGCQKEEFCGYGFLL